MAPLRSPLRIDRLEVENFKSYKGTQTIGPMKDFTAVIGPNGSGKSNLMDAISFVLGVKTSILRGNLKELIYSHTSPGGEAEVPATCFVRLVLTDPSRNDEEVTYERAIRPSVATDGTETHASVYRYRGRVVSYERYEEELQRIGVLVKARNFLVFQGDIESIASMSARDLTGLFEQISGSDAMRADYEAAEAAKQAAEERQMLLFSRKKSVLAEKRQKKEQKEEAEKHLAAQEELRDLKREYFLWQLHGMHQQAARLRSDRREILEEQKATAKTLVEAEGRLKKLEMESASQRKAALLAHKKVQQKQAEVDKHKPQLATLGEHCARAAKAAKKAEKRIADLRKRLAEQEKSVADLERQAADVEKIQQQHEEEVAGAEGGALSMEKGQLDEYNKLREEAGGQTIRIRSDLERMQAERNTRDDAKERIGGQIQSIMARLAVVTARKKETEEKLAAAQAGAGELEAALAERKRALREREERHEKDAAARERVEAQLVEVEGRIREARADRKESEKERKMAGAVRSMQDVIPGVHGRMADLGKVTAKKYNLALAMAMNKDMDAVVCDDEGVAKQCIQYLKDQRLPPLTFIPLSTISARPVNEQLRTMGGRQRLAIDCIEYDAKFERAFLYALGNCLVAETIEEARTLAYGPERHKVVSLDGTVFNRAGLITGGMSRDAQSRAGRWDDKEFTALKSQRDALQQQADQLGSDRALDLEMRELRNSVVSLEEQRASKIGELRALEERLAGFAADLKSLGEQRAKLVPELKEARKALAEAERKIDGLKKQYDEVYDRIFEDFSRKVGVGSIREYEETRLQQQMQLAERRAEYKTQLSKLQSALEYDRDRAEGVRGEIAKAERQLEEETQALHKYTGQRNKAEAAVAKLREAVEALLRDDEGAKAQSGEASREMAELKREIAAADKEGKAALGQLKDKDAAIEDLAAKVEEVVQQATMEGVELPRAEGGGEGAMEVDGEDGEGGPGDFDFSCIRRQYRGQVGRSQRERIEKEFQESIKALGKVLEELVPNLKALDQYEQIKQTELAHNKQLEEAKKEAREAQHEFHKVQESRLKVFMEAFEHISREIDDIYKNLTKSEVHVYGGTAYLSLENPEDPFAGGIKYTAMPPSKRFREMELLSGGEKTVAALALLFALHSHRPSPFFVLDEVDAALDAANIAKVANYIRARSRPGAEDSFQSIVISLKDAFFDKADALVGVTKDLEEHSSQILTFDLSAYQEA